MENVASKFCHTLGYINCIQICNKEPTTPVGVQKAAVYDLALACETGLFFGTLKGVDFELNTTESYFSEQEASYKPSLEEI